MPDDISMKQFFKNVEVLLDVLQEVKIRHFTLRAIEAPIEQQENVKQPSQVSVTQPFH